jgi:hypothetical protein
VNTGNVEPLNMVETPQVPGASAATNVMTNNAVSNVVYPNRLKKRTKVDNTGLCGLLNVELLKFPND